MVYFLIDAVVLGAVRPIVAWIAGLRVFARIGARIGSWVTGLGPYPTLVLFVAPLVLLEPAKPAGVYLIGTGHALDGVVLIGVAEVLKVVLVERLFRMSRDKLLTIAAFAWVHGHVVRWLDWLKALPPWRAVAGIARRMGRAARMMAGVLREWLSKFAKKR